MRAPDNVLNRACGYAEHSPECVCCGLSSCVLRSDVNDLGVGQLGLPVSLASRSQVVRQFTDLCLSATSAAFASHVHDVVTPGAQEQMRRITAGRVVAAVADKCFRKRRYVAVDENVGDSMRHRVTALEIHTTVAGGKSGSKPRPTFVWALFVNVIPKAISDGWGWICERMQVQLADGPRSTVALLAQAATVIGAFWVTSARQLGLRHDLFYRAFE
jgi:hypothetical protein